MYCKLRLQGSGELLYTTDAIWKGGLVSPTTSMNKQRIFYRTAVESSPWATSIPLDRLLIPLFCPVLDVVNYCSRYCALKGTICIFSHASLGVIWKHKIKKCDTQSVTHCLPRVRKAKHINSVRGVPDGSWCVTQNATRKKYVFRLLLVTSIMG